MIKVEESVLVFQFWKNTPAKMKRIVTIIVFFFISIIVTIAGTLTPLSAEEAAKRSEDLKQIRDLASDAGVTFIFGNNFMLCLSFFIPILGIIFGCYVLYNTGLMIAAESMGLGMSPLLSFLLLLIFPFAWLEFLAYSAAFAQSVWLTWRIIRHKARMELVNTCIMITICAVILLAAAFVEMFFIELLSPEI
ncbi:MAG: stage II sporulation protein M [Nitrososphaerota archaeon]|nr:stage II sporulation protein M [Candidatus Bathyarchaeota archaeon]MDW8023232.1 stage II sporulation protein M [Nitrososphaerota archaeon]